MRRLRPPDPRFRASRGVRELDLRSFEQHETYVRSRSLPQHLDDVTGCFSARPRRLVRRRGSRGLRLGLFAVRHAAGSSACSPTDTRPAPRPARRPTRDRPRPVRRPTRDRRLGLFAVRHAALASACSPTDTRSACPPTDTRPACSPTDTRPAPRPARRPTCGRRLGLLGRPTRGRRLTLFAHHTAASQCRRGTSGHPSVIVSDMSSIASAIRRLGRSAPRETDKPHAESPLRRIPRYCEPCLSLASSARST
jgi:hypothetical protein